MNRKTPQSVHEDDWRNIKKDYDLLRNDKDISKRMKLLSGFFEKYKPKKILDVGCGSGYMGYLIKKINRNASLTGFDISEYAVGMAQSYDKVYLLDIDKEDIPENSGYFDMVVCGDVLEHIYDVDHCLNEMKRVLKVGGTAIITAPNFSYWKYRLVCLLGGIPSILLDHRHLHAFNHEFLFNKCVDEKYYISYSARSKRDIVTKVAEKMFNKTIVLVVTKRE